ncbi:MAG: hypothetical protein ABSA43_01080 [Candidatus Microgenomates bacterium]|jgi:hypothetical protein
MNKPKQIVWEPFEVLKSAGEQVFGAEPQPPETPQPPKPIEPTKEEQLKQKMQVRGQRQIQALETEIADIRRQREKKRQEELLAEQQARQEIPPPLIQPSSKPDRKFAGEGLGAKRQQTHVEKPLPPSG